MAKLDFNYGSTRSEKARIGVSLSRVWLTALTISTFLLIFAGVALVAIESAAGWALIGLSAIPAMIVEWYRGELHNLPVVTKPKAIDDVLSADILGRLSRSVSPYDIAMVATSVTGGQFFATRFGISSSFLLEMSSKDVVDTESVWNTAWQLQTKTKSKNISAAILITALVHQSAAAKSLLNHLQLDSDDLLQGVRWYNHLREVIDKRHTPRRTGGIARDWSFGWTPLLNRFGQNISAQIGAQGSSLIELVAHNESLEQMIGMLSKKGRQNATLIGPSGVGKTEIVYAFASKLLDASTGVPDSLRFRQVFILDASALIAAAPGRGDLEQLIPRILSEAYNAKNIIICFDNAQLFFEDGVGSIDVSNVLLPFIEAGRVRMILTIDEQRFLQINRRNPALANVLNRISVPAASRDETIAVMQDQSIVLEFQNHVTYMHQAMAEAYRLSQRYVHELAMPGRALRLLESAAHYSEGGLVTAASVQQAIEKTLDVKVSVASGEDEREKLLNLEQLIHERMINQTRAVSVVSDALRRARAGVRNQDRPIGTFMFLGPTGVGKSELAKALADIYFGGEDRMVRMDMNEFSGANDVERLIADGADDPNSLTARIIKQPFSVVLLDEVEKAHPNVLATLLQMLDEGVLRDIKNREVSFRDAIIISTSNAGADTIREYIERGYNIEQFEDQFVDGLIDSNQFRPEFLNRFDEIVVFRPLTKPELVQVVDLMLAGVNKNLALQKVTVSVTQEAKEYLVDAGYDPRLGARPMRRVVQRTVENTVAKQMLGGSVNPGDVIEIDLDQVRHLIENEKTANSIIASSK